MSAPIYSFPIVAPGKYGLNTQEASSMLGTDWATEAVNCVFDSAGRLASRKGWATIHTALAGSPLVKTIFEYIKSDLTSYIISAAGNAIYHGVSGTLTAITPTTAPTADHWKFQNFNGKVVGFQASHIPIYWTGTSTFSTIHSTYTAWAASTVYSVNDVRKATTGNTTLIFKCTTAGTSAATEPTWSTTYLGTTTDGTVTWTTYVIPNGNECLSAFGRVWAFDSTGTSVFYSGLLDETDWASTSSGVLDLSKVWPIGLDQGVALAEFGNNLIIFGKNSVVVYAGADDPTNMYLLDTVSGVGCVARDSVQNIGTDILFLSSSGVRSFSRTITQNTMPLQDITKHVRDNVVLHTNAATVANIKSTYNEPNGFYLLAFPDTAIIVCIDTRSPLQDGAYRVTTWDSMDPRSFCTTRSGTLYVGEPGHVAQYTNYSDNGSAFTMGIKLGWSDFGDSSVMKIIKRMSALIYTGYSVSVSMSWQFDFSLSENTGTDSITASGIAEYNVGQFNISEYGGGAGLHNVSVTTTGTGSQVQLGMSSSVSNSIIAVQQLTIYMKKGRIS